ncbi:LysR substrate-binding domain-containing protein [Pseudomonas sp. RIT-PI-AD]|uniref:LysR substrate-binding domain-containing protein n=1 Tax=Pseudomonas sp. RIT-PI-AD TaxID=3035294 RepID=UPI0021DA4370|nr:LysR substrate-binding domain-containing protein [Pseudomonas sp. RIT-PI-AD]
MADSRQPDLHPRGSADLRRDGGSGFACLPDCAIRRQLRDGTLLKVPDERHEVERRFSVRWPGSRPALPRLRVFAAFLTERLLADAVG